MLSPGSHLSWSFANAFVERTAPVKGVVIVNKKFLSAVETKEAVKVMIDKVGLNNL